MIRPTPLRLVADANMPYAEAALGRFGVVTCVPGRAISREMLADADALFVRSVTRVGRALLEGTPVRFVGSATAGTDHVDLAALEALGVGFAAAPGSNAASVVDYVLAALLATLAARGEGLERAPGHPRTLGIVGVGAVGGRLARRAEALGLRVLRCDPPLAAQAAAAQASAAVRYVSLDELLREADVVSLHTPLTEGGAYPTRGLVDARALAAMRPGAWLVNAARGAVVQGRALEHALARGAPAEAILDVWEGEPAPDPALVRAVRFGTPHIAGYAYDGKVEGTRMVADAFGAWLAAQGLAAPPPWDPGPALGQVPPPMLAPPPAPDAPPGAPETAAWLDALVRQAYDLRADDARFRAAMLGQGGAAPDPARRAEAFTALRAHYPERRLFARIPLADDAVPPRLRRMIREGLGFARPAQAP